MRELVVLSGKGGTGKTSLTAAFAAMARNAMLCDADVDAADLHLIMKPEIIETHDFQGGNEAVIDGDRCVGCGRCQEVCRFNAVIWDASQNFFVDPLDCEGCGVCVDLCPAQAIDFPRKTCGQWFDSRTRFGAMIHARLGIAEENSGRLVALVREEARKRAMADKLDLLITDGPPGIGCPVIASMGQATAILIVTEPTVSGIHDMERVADLAAHFKLPAMVCINKCDLNPHQAETIADIARDRSLELVGQIPFDPAFTRAMVRGEALVESPEESPAGDAVKKIWNTILKSPSMSAENQLERLC